MWKVREQMVGAVVVRVHPDRLGVEHVQQFRALCEEHRGRARLYFEILMPGVPQPQRVRSRTCVVDPAPALMRGMRTLFGPENIRLEGTS